MRQGQQNKRMRGRGGRKGPNPLTRSYESNGPDVKVRGTPLHIAEKYAQLARDAQASGDRVQSENLLQHAEHYYRIVAAAQAQAAQQQAVRNDGEGDEADQGQRGNGQDRQQARQDNQPAFGISDPQPYINGNGQDRDGDGEQTAGDNDREPEQQSEGGGGRGRRRRPYRARSGGQDGDDRAGAPPPARNEEPAEAAANDD